MYSDAMYSGRQLVWITLGRNNDSRYGNIDDLDPKVYDDLQMFIISKGRGDDPAYANVDYLDPEKYFNANMIRISLEKGHHKKDEPIVVEEPVKPSVLKRAGISFLVATVFVISGIVLFFNS